MMKYDTRFIYVIGSNWALFKEHSYHACKAIMHATTDYQYFEIGVDKRRQFMDMLSISERPRKLLEFETPTERASTCVASTD